jgi:peptidoglycan hydrolase-like protein with peptidoglycan-binding domain
MPTIAPISGPGSTSRTTVSRGYEAAPAIDYVLAGRAKLERGLEGDSVRWLQQQLGLDVDGKFGPQTEKAVKAYQRRNGLSVDGVVGRQTLGRLHDGYQPGPVSPQPRPPTSPEGTGTKRAFRGFHEVSEEKLRDALPPQAKHLAKTFIDAARKYDLDPNFLVAISKFETGGWTSSAFKNKHNAMGVSNARGPISFDRAEDSIERMAKALSNPRGPYRSASTIGEVGAIYAPVGAGNDPNATNGYWPRSVGTFTDEFTALLG